MGHDYELTGLDVLEAHRFAIEAAAETQQTQQVRATIEHLLATDGPMAAFMKRSLNMTTYWQRQRAQRSRRRIDQKALRSNSKRSGNGPASVGALHQVQGFGLNMPATSIKQSWPPSRPAANLPLPAKRTRPVVPSISVPLTLYSLSW